ncbi:MAG TPA: glycosyltransferase family 4 protein [Candidatus Methylomirabilis sp.]|nr:glycosyltransferase family 4 protein [Candidatus Methylomirabilis sp.]
MTFVHMLTDSYWPDRGGMEESVARIAHLLTRSGDRTCTIYVRDTRPPAEGATDPGGGTVVYLWNAKAALAPPVLASVTTYPEERYRLDYLLFKNAVAEAVARHASSRHVIVSFYLTTAGFLAQHVAAELGIPHVARATGSDLSADLHNPHRMAPVEFVLRRASHVVTLSREQARWLEFAGVGAERVTMIHNSLPDDSPAERWRFRPEGDVHIVSDSGYRFQKGTHLLFAAFRGAVRDGVRATLTVVGPAESRARAYRERERASLSEELGDRVRLLDWMDKPKVHDLLLVSHLYCAPTLGEGCSLARLAALALGMPIVSTACGELPDLAADMDHVRLVPPGSIVRLAAVLEQTVRDLPRMASQIDGHRLNALSEHLSPSRELAQWDALLGEFE